MKFKFVFQSIICLTVLLGVAGCETTGNLTKLSSGKMANSLASGILGGEFGKTLDQTSMNNALQAEYAALEKGRSGFPVAWKGSTGFAGKVVPQQPYQVGSTNCRRYDHIILDHGTEKRATGTACRTSNGAWVPLT